MNTVLAELGRRYVERWVAVLVLPGLLYVAGAVAAHRLGHAHWADVGRLAGLLDPGGPLGGGRTSLWVLAFVVLPVLSAAAGLAARGAAAALGRLWFDPWPYGLRRLARRRTAARAKRWRAADRAYLAELEGSGARPPAEARARIDALAARRNAVALGPPGHPTWTGDRLGAVGARVWAWYRLDVVFAWPRLWLVLEESEQNALRAARAELDTAVTLAGWGVLGLLPAVWWWPAPLVAAGVFAVGLRRTRAAVDTLAHLTEAAFDLRAAVLARELGFDVPEGRLSPETGAQVTAHLRKHV
ncbi:hypothetical protein [Streptomyces albireticuli]|uniref:Vegetative cell wall protein gp1 n=1 Tax=Streptomyces albireticuli TaxID=1940 RepID=A0A2A2DD58_9ACTN|nr:hypothetical protein [Streptomyces albireticuli]MCD9144946.1 hypothetical protein [Streptomyces albireticuli]MCD9164372.1 hypothetical protein [Streptomyces albireticuli]MCD9194083.1 hypothetical protein [Streptomyces albireticuli]PAU49377.1 hypothetical protein CK936_07945 [Streptomyces albireticuli]